jgi:ketosteroid isomerase-like protein
VSVVEDVLAAARSRARALVESDAVLLRALMHPDLRWTTFRGEVLSRDEYVRGNTAGSLRWVAQTLEEPEVIVVGETAVLIAVVVDAVECDGQPQTYRLRLSQTWVRTGEGWQCLAGHAGPALDAA